ncbi:MAG TPA: hypothetical protein VF766_15140 [Pyrinomonadaceae bacterium]
MIRILVSLMLAYLLVFTAAPVLAGTRPDKQDESVEQVRAKIERLGIGEKARATVRLKNGTKIKGYIDQVRSDDFVIKDRNTGAPMNILYSDVSKVESNKGHSTAKMLGIGIAIGVGVVLAIIGITISSLD